MKAKLKPKAEEKEIIIPDGMTAKDLSLDNRVKLYNQAFEKFKKESADTFGLGLAMEIAWMPQAAVPRQVLVDLLKKENDGNANETATPKGEA